ncbi:MAG: hypothetical protein L7V85_08245 [Bacteroidia bacterium]|nr:hypothetical protein [Bacteroidia bacterium]
MTTQHNTTITLILLLCSVFTAQAQQEVLTRENGGASWRDASVLSGSTAALNFTPSTGSFTYTTDDDDHTVIDENTGSSKQIELHSSSIQGKILVLVNRTSNAISFTGSISGYNGINGSSVTSVTANSSVKIQWDSGSSAWYEIINN